MAKSQSQPEPNRDQTLSEPSTGSAPQPRRHFLSALAAVVVGGIVMVVPLLAGFLFFLDPLRPRKKRAAEDDVSVDADGFVKITILDALPADGTPQLYRIIADRTDAWTYFPKQPIGAIYLQRLEDGDVLAMSVECPHLGCAVNFIPEKHEFHCPCHDSSFALTGERSESSPSARDLDRLEHQVREDNQIWVKYQKFRPAKAEKIPVT